MTSISNVSSTSSTQINNEETKKKTISKKELAELLMELASLSQKIEAMVSGSTTEDLQNQANQSSSLVTAAKAEFEAAEKNTDDINKKIEKQKHLHWWQKLLGVIVDIGILVSGIVTGDPAEIALGVAYAVQLADPTLVSKFMDTISGNNEIAKLCIKLGISLAVGGGFLKSGAGFLKAGCASVAMAAGSNSLEDMAICFEKCTGKTWDQAKSAVENDETFQIVDAVVNAAVMIAAGIGFAKCGNVESSMGKKIKNLMKKFLSDGKMNAVRMISAGMTATGTIASSGCQIASASFNIEVGNDKKDLSTSTALATELGQIRTLISENMSRNESFLTNFSNQFKTTNRNFLANIFSDQASFAQSWSQAV